MTDHKFTDEALVSKLGEMTTGGHCCDDCSYAEFPHPACKQLIMDQAYDLINRQRAEIKMLTENSISTKYPNHVLCSKGVILTKSLEDYDKLISDISAEAIKEFAERLKEWAYSGYSRRAIPECVFVSVEQINDLVEEMTEGKPCTEGADCSTEEGEG